MLRAALAHSAHSRSGPFGVFQPRSVWRELSASYVVYGFSGSDVTNVVVGGETVVQR